MPKDMISRSDVEEFIKGICKERGVLYHELLSKSRAWKLVAVRREISIVLLSKGFSLKRVGKYLKRDHTTIYHYIRGQEIPGRLRAYRPDIDDKDIADLITMGFSFAEVAESYNVSDSTIHHRFKKPLKDP